VIVQIAAVALVVFMAHAWARRRRQQRAQPVALEPGSLARALREDELQQRVEQLERENAQLAELAALRRELMRLACRAHGLTGAADAKDAELFQALRAVAIQHDISERRMRRELTVRDDALAALGALVLHERVDSGQYSPAELVRRVAARARGGHT
jgi:hypothetical protein